MKHTFHTRHDFTPALAWSVFQLLAECDEGLEVADMEEVARTLSSPMARRADLHKPLLSLEELGLIERLDGRVVLSASGRTMALTAGRYETGFAAVVHCLYAWSWVWQASEDIATPSWSYRQVCRAIRTAGPLGVETDAVVLRVAAAGERFGVDRVSFSRSSVNGVTVWLKNQSPPLVEQAGNRTRAVAGGRPGLTTVRLHAAALCAQGDAEAPLDEGNLEMLADGFLVPPGDVPWILADALPSTGEFHILEGKVKRLVFRESQDPYLNWIVHG